MGDIVIHVENLGKRYRIGELKRYKALRDTLSHALYAPFRAAASLLNGRNGLEPADTDRSSNNHIWSLKDVSFNIKKGEAVGIIGRNGAGKSTLLKILSRITRPTEGYVRIHGRVGSLLEVGTGFHPELTGRDNVYLNGAILGMRKIEIDRKFDEIVAFAEIEKFIDTPVKLYSSGMYVRLAFAVAAHLEPEILIVDEVLAVGDAAFQKKCLGKMGDVAEKGRTVLFVSHNMAAVKQLTVRSILIDGGRAVLDASSTDVIDRYLNSDEQIATEAVVDLRHHPRRLPGMTSALTRMWMTDARGNIVTATPMGSDVTFNVEYEVENTVPKPIVGLTFEANDGQRLFGTNNKIAPGAKKNNAPGRAVVSCHVRRLPLTSGEYFITVAFAMAAGTNFDKIERPYKLIVTPADVYGTGHVPPREHGLFILDAEWQFTPSLLSKEPLWNLQPKAPHAGQP